MSVTENASFSTEGNKDTLILYRDLNGRDRTKKTRRFGPQTQVTDIKTWISSWRKSVHDFDLEIRDSDGSFLDFDEIYIDEFGPPFVVLGSSPSVVVLQVVEKCDKTTIAVPNVSQETSNGTSTVPVQQQHRRPAKSIAEQPSNDAQESNSANRFYSLCASDPVIINKNNVAMRFTKNVNNQQRDQYKTDHTKAANGEQNGCYVRIQGDKKDLERKQTYGTVYPRFKIESIIPANERARSSLLIFLICEICNNGKRTLYHNEERQFITDGNINMNKSTSFVNAQASNENQDKGDSRRAPIIRSLTDKMFTEEGEELDLKHSVIVRGKTYSTNTRSLFCELHDRYPNDINYETTRLACLLEKSGMILWDQLLLSDSMAFSKSKKEIRGIKIIINNILIETIIVRSTKRKMNSKISGTVSKRPLTGKKAQQYVPPMDIPVDDTNQYSQNPTNFFSLQNLIEHPVFANEGQFQDQTVTNEYMRQHHHNRIPQHSMTDSFSPQCMSLPTTVNNHMYENLQNQSSGATYFAQLHTNNERGMSMPTTSSQFPYNFVPYDQQTNLSQTTSSLPGIGWLIPQHTRNTSSENADISSLVNPNEDFTDMAQYDAI